MAYNVLKGTIHGTVDQHADQEIGGVKVFKNTVSASVFWDTDAQSPCATMKDVAITDIAGKTKEGVLIYDQDGIAKTSHTLVYKNDTLQAKNIKAQQIAGSGKGLINLPADQFDGEISAAYLNYSNGLHNVRGALQVKASDCINVDEDGIGINLNADCGLWLKSNKLTLDLTKTENINSRGQNLSDDDIFLRDERQRPINKKRLEEWSNVDNIPLGSETRKYYERNKKLIDLSMIPEDISESIINRYKNYKVNDRSLLLQYFIDNKLKALIENINDF